MQLFAVIFACFFAYTDTSQSDRLFDINADSLFKSIIGREPDHIHETTHSFANYNATEKRKRYFNKLVSESVKTNTTIKPTGNINDTERPLTEAELKKRIKYRKLERLINEQINPIPNFNKGDDDPELITRRFQEIHKNNDARRQVIREYWYSAARRNLWRNRTITIMQHFIYATRYKLPYAQILRKKYLNSYSYQIGYCFSLLANLKRQQLLMYTQLKLFQFEVSTLHLHMRLYEKIVRLDVDMKDLMRHIRMLESKRRLQEDPNYYDEYVHDDADNMLSKAPSPQAPENFGPSGNGPGGTGELGRPPGPLGNQGSPGIPVNPKESSRPESPDVGVNSNSGNPGKQESQLENANVVA